MLCILNPTTISREPHSAGYFLLRFSFIFDLREAVAKNFGNVFLLLGRHFHNSVTVACLLQYAHRKCVQRWCNEKGDIICEICRQVISHFIYDAMLIKWRDIGLLAFILVSAIQAWLYSTASTATLWGCSNEFQVLELYNLGLLLTRVFTRSFPLIHSN